MGTVTSILNVIVLLSISETFTFPHVIVLLPLLSRGSIGGEKNIFLIGSVIHEVEGLLMAQPLMDDTPLLTHTISFSLGNSKVAPNMNIFIIYKPMLLQ